MRRGKRSRDLPDLAEEIVQKTLCNGCQLVSGSPERFPMTCDCAQALQMGRAIDEILDSRGVPDEYRRGDE